MNFLLVFCYILFAYGIANMVCYAEGPFNMFSWWREVADNISEGFGKLFNCMMCFSTWVGLLASIVDLLIPSAVFTPFNLILAGSGLWWLIPILDAGLTSGSVWLLHNLEEAFERHGAIAYIDEKEGEE
jgi:hypothetical protein